MLNPKKDNSQEIEQILKLGSMVTIRDTYEIARVCYITENTQQIVNLGYLRLWTINPTLGEAPITNDNHEKLIR